MSIHTELPKEWVDIKVDNKIIFINMKESIVSFHPPMKIENLGVFLNLYNFSISKEEVMKKIEGALNIKSTNSKAEPIFIPDLPASNHLKSSTGLDLKPKDAVDFNPISDGNI
jgi:hypothetical protein